MRLRTRYRHLFRLAHLLKLVFLIYIAFILRTVFVYHHFVRTYSFPTVPFWKDNRTVAYTSRPLPLPVTTTKNVNLSNATLIITACCRNVEKHLIGFRHNVLSIGALFGYYRIYLSESDSNDGTLEFLQEWARNDSKYVRVYTEGQQRWRVFARTKRLSLCRNNLLQYARHDLPQFDFYLVLDVDVTSSPTFTTTNFLSNFIYPPFSWAVMTATQTSEYYDIWALRTWPTLTFDCWHRIRHLTGIFIDQTLLYKRLIGIHQAPIPREHPLIEVQSAFGGAAIYAARYISDECVYDGWADHGWWWYREQCEHVSFNQCVRRQAGGGKLFINPKFQIH